MMKNTQKTDSNFKTPSNGSDEKDMARDMFLYSLSHFPLSERYFVAWY